MDIEGAVAIVTGGARGIGRASAELLLSHGAKVGTLQNCIAKDCFFLTPMLLVDNLAITK